MNNSLYAFLCILLLFSCKEESNKKSQEATDLPPITDVFQAYYEDNLKIDPIDATFSGKTEYNDMLPNTLSLVFIDRKKQFYRNYLSKLAQYDTDQLSEEDYLSYNVLKWQCETGLKQLEFPYNRLVPINQFSSLPQTIGQFASGMSAQPFHTLQDHEKWLSRLGDYLVWCDTAIVNMRKGIGDGYILPKSLIEKVIPQMEALAKGPPSEHLFFGPVKTFPDIFTDKQKDSLRAVYSEVIDKRVIPQYQKLTEFFRDEYLPAGRTTSGIGDIPDGAAYYQQQIKIYTTTELTAEQIHEIGLAEVARLESEMEKVMDEAGFKGTLPEFFDAIRNNKDLMPYNKPEQVIEHFYAIYDKMKPNLKKLFDLTPRTGFEVRRTEAFREESASAEYNQGSLDGTRPGIFYVPIPDVKAYNILSDEDLFLHEAIPGHHYQISLQQENTDLPAFRKTIWYSAYGEGWALYSESLGKELGLYTDPYQYFGMLSAEMHRAIRLVVDTGIHAKGWSREKAIEYSLSHEAESEASVIAEIERYMSWPGQALSYKIGQLKIIELRNKAHKAFGDKFDIKEFHNRVLESGCLPLELLEDKINRWIMAENKAG
ncbi:DUF885 domain-containing protein [Robertkochia solimangrovi]|uniref:DUF885 domain-containing protein n=1 Tax=Robertkochia solimangrovi TaxID=2213046 RepID=UPI00117E5DAB|nr:DUF885 domain-containing protein [Robertkochia solimangrovi]TRZ41789.1 DUF885 domain-containing protein [Robertkochia solimangrovi]